MNLSDEEKKIIQNKRLEDEEVKKEQEKFQSNIRNARIDTMKKEIKNEIRTNQKLVEAYKDAFIGLLSASSTNGVDKNPVYTLSIDDFTKEFTAGHYKDGKHIVFDTKEVKLKKCEIQCTLGSGYTIKIKEHIVYGNKWATAKSRGFKMVITEGLTNYNDRYYSRHKKVHELITRDVDSRQCSENLNLLVEKLQEDTFQALTRMYPKAKIKKDETWSRYDIKNCNLKEHNKIRFVNVEFSNGLLIDFIGQRNENEELEFSIKSICAEKLDPIGVANVLMNLTAK